MAQAQTIEPTNFDEINFQITSKENPDAYIESRFVPGNSAYARSSEEDGKTLVGYVDATVYVEETYTKGEDGNIFTTDSRLLSEEEVMSIGKSEFDVPVQSVQPRISTIGDKTTSRGKLTIRFTVMAYFKPATTPSSDVLTIFAVPGFSSLRRFTSYGACVELSALTETSKSAANLRPAPPAT